MTTPEVARLLQVALKATDLAASIAFYRDRVRLPLIAEFTPPGIAFFAIGATRLMLSPTSTEGTLYLAVDDIHAAHRSLAARGVVFERSPALVHRDDAGLFGPAGEEEWMAFFRDPAGNLLALAGRQVPVQPEA